MMRREKEGRRRRGKGSDGRGRKEVYCRRMEERRGRRKSKGVGREGY